MLKLGQLKKEPLSGQTKCIVINLTILEQRVIVALLVFNPFYKMVFHSRLLLSIILQSNPGFCPSVHRLHQGFMAGALFLWKKIGSEDIIYLGIILIYGE